MSKLNLTLEHWTVVRPDLVVAGSSAQARNVLEMALQDIATLAADRDRIERNRDMWKGQCDRQADQLRYQQWQPMALAPKDGRCILAVVAPDRGRDLEIHAGRMFVIRHEGQTESGHDLGWAVYPGFGGASDSDFIRWKTLHEGSSNEHR